MNSLIRLPIPLLHGDSLSSSSFENAKEGLIGQKVMERLMSGKDKKSIKDIYTFLIFAICFTIFEFTNIQTVFVVIAVIILSILISIFGGKK